MSSLRLGLTLVALASLARAASHPGLPLDRPYSLRNPEPFLLEREHGRLASGRDLLSFIHPRPCDPAVDGPAACGYGGRLAYADSAREERIHGTLVFGFEDRYHDANAATGEGGLLLAGHKGPAAFRLDARIFAESSDRTGPSAFDREEVDLQSDSVTGAGSYGSFARYRGSLSLDTRVGRLTVARDAVHWGPGLFENLAFHQDAVPFNQYVFTTRMGPLSIASLHGDLTVDDHYISTANLADKNLYAHRYELRAGSDVVIGVSEQIILFDEDKPYLFTPIFPLFVAKTFMYEHANNGNLAADIAWRRPGLGVLYAEFLLDDLESPSSLITKDYRQNKWAWMAGAHAVRDWRGLRTGAVIEYSRIEPWVYTHFDPNTAQTTHLGHPLGNQQGPNTQSVVAKAYARSPSGWYASLTARLLWEGTGPGSSVNEPFTGALEPKHFLSGEDGPELRLNPFVSYVRGPFAVELEAGRLAVTDARARVMASW